MSDETRRLRKKRSSIVGKLGRRASESVRGKKNRPERIAHCLALLLLDRATQLGGTGRPADSRMAEMLLDHASGIYNAGKDHIAYDPYFAHEAVRATALSQFTAEDISPSGIEAHLRPYRQDSEKAYEVSPSPA